MCHWRAMASIGKFRFWQNDAPTLAGRTEKGDKWSDFYRWSRSWQT
ncbi:UNVERIFIED_CONTAM: hypothetical protein GTU68_006971 [Idotea baltica]|nr:hypothetical protein [Idotea baltica]